MSIVISEYSLTDSQIKEYHDKGYRVAMGYEDPVIHKGESVGFLLDTIYKGTIEHIERLLYTKHNVTLKYQGDTFKLNTLDEWKYSRGYGKDAVTFKHPILQIYEAKRQDYYDKLNAKKIEVKYNDLYDAWNIDPSTIPNEDELNEFLKTFGYLYQIDIDYNDHFDKILKYVQINYYLDNDVPYANEPHSINPDEEPMFSNLKFQELPYEEPIEVESFGDETYLEDFVYKNVKEA